MRKKLVSLGDSYKVTVFSWVESLLVKLLSSWNSILSLLVDLEYSKGFISWKFIRVWSYVDTLVCVIGTDIMSITVGVILSSILG